MRVLMFGWEFPPFNSGGLGTACLGLTKGLANQGVRVNFVVPKSPEHMQNQHGHVDITVASRVKGSLYTEDPYSIPGVQFEEIDTLLTAYMTESEYTQKRAKVTRMPDGSYSLTFDEDTTDDAVYGKNLYQEVMRYSQKAALIAQQQQFDVIHAHDWLTYKAGIAAKHVSNKPLVCHIHATEFDRTGGNCNQTVYDIEREGFLAADKIIAVSNLTKRTVVERYGISADKVQVVHNAVEFTEKNIPEKQTIPGEDKIVLFLGRITIQKGPEYFFQAAQKVLEKQRNVTFVVAGDGDMMKRMVDYTHHLGIADKVKFTGFLRGPDIDRAYQMADLYVMPSVSEPFGITPLESMRNGTPVLISKTSGVSEVVDHALKVDFWDVNQMASKILGTLQYPALYKTLKQNGQQEVQKFDWNIPAQHCVDVYREVL